MRQLTLATANFEKHGKMTRRARFLADMERVVPWRELCGVVEPFYPKPPFGASTGPTNSLIQRPGRSCLRISRSR